MPTPEELFTKLNGRELFTKLRCEITALGHHSHRTVSIYQAAIRSGAVLAIFQQIMDKILGGLSQTDGILDDQIITGEDDAQYTQS